MGRKNKHLRIIPAATAVTAGAAAAYSYITAAFRAVAKRHSIIKNHDENDNSNLIFTQSFDGIKLAGVLRTAENPKRIVIAMHGWRSSWARDFHGITDFLNDCGCTLLLPDQRSHGKSEGEYISYGIIERYDVIAWCKYIRDNIKADLPVYLFGISMGAATVLMTVDLDFPVRINGIIADCGYTSPEKIIRKTARAKHLPSKLAYPVIDRKFRHDLGHSFSEINIPDLLKHSTIPTLFIHGSNDTFVPPEMTMENYTACASPKELLIVEGASHAKSYAVNPLKYEKAIMDFFSKYDDQ